MLSVSTTPFCLCKIFMNAVQEQLLGFVMKYLSIKKGMTPVLAEENKVSVSYKLVNSVMKSHKAALSDDH